jgi:hypothetical protein
MTPFQGNTKTEFPDNAKSTGNLVMNLEIWVDGSLGNLHVFFERSPSEIGLTSCKIYREELNIRRIFIGNFKIAN